MSDERPNILLIITEHHRWDALGIEGHPALQTPYLDEMAAGGVRFRHAYTACPVCIPARRTLMTGRKPSNHGVVMNYDTYLDGPTLPGILSAAGYQAHLVGKLHFWPQRKLYGFDSADWADSPRDSNPQNDYCRWLVSEGVKMPHAGLAHGMDVNGYPVRPFHMEERFHFTNWCVDRALEFLERRDPTVPFFLNVSFHQPHQPLTPPRFYYDKYMAMDLPEPVVGDWARVYDGPQRGLPVATWRACFEPIVQKQYQAAYYGCIEHIDHQLGRLFQVLPANTIIVFTSDHGEMLGDHQWIRKRNAYEPSAHVPLLLRLPQGLGLEQRCVMEQPVELMDIMPTLLEAAGADAPEGMDGRSLLPLLRGEGGWRDYVHGECSSVPTLNSGQQYLTDGRRKYVWLPGRGQEQFFDLEQDPREMHDLAADPSRAEEVALWRSRLTEELKGRPEGFVVDGRLVKLDGPTPPYLPGYKQEDRRM